MFGNTAAPKFTPYVAFPSVRMIAFHLNYAYIFTTTLYYYSLLLTTYVAFPGVRMIAFHLNYAYTYVHTYTSRDIMDIRMHIRIRHRMIAFHLNRVEGLWFRFRV